jgi:hypothetical protein
MLRVGECDDVVRLLGCSKARAYQLARDFGDRLGAFRLGRQLRWDLDKLEAAIAAGGVSFEGGWRRAPEEACPGSPVRE